MISLESVVIHVQYLFRKKKKLFAYLQQRRTLLYDAFFRITNNVQHIHSRQMIGQDKFNRMMVYLEQLLVDYHQIINDMSAHSILSLTPLLTKTYYTRLSTIVENLIKICQVSGANSLQCLLYLVIDPNMHISNSPCTEYEKLLQFYNIFFVPTTCHLYRFEENIAHTKSNPSVHLDNNFKESILSLSDLPDDKNDNDSPSNPSWPVTGSHDTIDVNKDINLIYQTLQSSKKFILPFCTELPKTNHTFQRSLTELIFGARVYLPLPFYKCFMVMNGYFLEDNLNMARVGGTLQYKLQELECSLSKINNIPLYFKKAYVHQISVKDFVVYPKEDLVEQCMDAHKQLVRLKNKPITSLVKEFLSGDIQKQRHILTLFLLTESDTDTQYLAHLMYDMISNESYLLKPQPLAEQVYNSLHWSVQKLFKVAIHTVNRYTNRLLNFNEDDIPYEKRICLLKAPDNVKSKAMEKLKEINQKSNESSSKAQQYLDGILKIPFGIYQKEKILSFLKEFISKFESWRTQFLENKKKSSLQNCALLQKNQKITAKELSLFFEQAEKLMNWSQHTESDSTPMEKIEKWSQDKLSTHAKCSECIRTIKKHFHMSKLELSTGQCIYLTVTEGTKRVNISVSQLQQEIVTFIMDDEERYGSLQHILELPSVTANHQDSSKHKKEHLHYTLESLYYEWNLYVSAQTVYMKKVRQSLENAVYGHKEAKNQVERIIAQWIHGEMKGYCLGFEGPPGTGKTSLAKRGMIKCLEEESGECRPFSFIALGGSSNGATLEGHSYTYVGSTWGRIVDILMESKCMNPIIYVDELDKVSHTEHGKEIIGVLTHLTDQTQNDEFCDKYFSGIKLDLSQCLFIFSYNDPEMIDSILLDRIHRIQFNPLKRKEKLHICTHYLLPEIYEAVGFGTDDIIFSNDVLDFIINNYTYEAGARKLREKLFEIVREINLRWLLGENISFPYEVTEDFLSKDIFSNKHKIHTKTISPTPRIGLVNGLYATHTGLGGLTIIEAFRVPSDNRLSLELTGQQGDVMKESMKVAKTIAWNILPHYVKSAIHRSWSQAGTFGIHIHCPEGGTPKDGPSAGAAITCTIVSLLTHLPACNTVAMTGEIDLNGSIHPIGGLETKLNGAKKAGVKKVLCPRLNSDDLERITKEDEHLLDEEFQVIIVDTIWDVLPHIFPQSSVEFIDYTQPDSRITIDYLSPTKIMVDATQVLPDTTIDTIQWSQTHGSDDDVVIETPTQSQTKILIPSSGTYHFQIHLNLVDQTTRTYTTKIYMLPPPRADISSLPIIQHHQCYLDGSLTQHFNNSLHHATWELMEGAENAIIQQPHVLKTLVTQLETGTYKFRLTVTDQYQRSSLKDIVVEVSLPTSNTLLELKI